MCTKYFELAVCEKVSVESLKNTIVELQAGESSVHTVAKKYGTPSSMLNDYVHDTSKQIGTSGLKIRRDCLCFTCRNRILNNLRVR